MKLTFFCHRTEYLVSCVVMAEFWSDVLTGVSYAHLVLNCFMSKIFHQEESELSLSALQIMFRHLNTRGK